MDQRTAAEKTVAAAWKRRHDLPGKAGDGVSFAHMLDMLHRLREMDDTGQMSAAKMGRWLGYMQGVLVAKGVLTLDDAKEINRSCAADPEAQR